MKKMKVDYSLGKRLERERDIIAKNLNLMRKYIALQLTHELLSGDMTLESSLVEVRDTLGDNVNSLPANDEGVYWGRTLVPLAKEMGELDPPLMKHIGTYADQLQSKAERCSK